MAVVEKRVERSRELFERGMTMREYVAAIYGWEDQTQRTMFEEKFDPRRLRIIRVEGNDAGLTQLLTGPFIRNYSGDPRFAALCRKLNLPVPQSGN